MASAECQQKACSGKRKAESSFAGDEEYSLNDRANKKIVCSEGEGAAALVVAGDEEYSLNNHANKKIDCSEGEKAAAAAALVVAGDEGEVAPPKKMWRLPREEVDWILAQSNEPVCAEFRDLKRANPSLVPSTEEEKDPSTVLLYTCARVSYEDEDKFAKFQAWVRGEYASKGFVEVDYDYFGRRAEAIRVSNEARDEVFKDYDFSSDSEDDCMAKLIKRTVRSFSETNVVVCLAC